MFEADHATIDDLTAPGQHVVSFTVFANPSAFTCARAVLGVTDAAIRAEQRARLQLAVIPSQALGASAKPGLAFTHATAFDAEFWVALLVRAILACVAEIACAPTSL